MGRKLMIKESNNKTIYDDIVKKVLTPYLEPYAKSAIKLFDSPFSVYNKNKGLVTIGESMLGNVAYNYAKENGYSSAVLNLVGNYYDVDTALVISVKDGKQRTYPKFKNLARTTGTSVTKELIGLSIKLNDVIRDIANELIREFKGVTNESMRRAVRSRQIKESYSIETVADFINELKSIYNKYFPYGELVILDLDDHINAELYADKNRASDYDDLFDISINMNFNNKFKSNSSIDNYKINMRADALTKDVSYPSIKVNSGFDKIALPKTYGDYDTILDEFNGYCQAIKAKMKELRRSKKLPSEFVRIAEINESMKRSKVKMVRKINESANYNIDANKLAKQVNSAIKDAVKYVNSNDASPTWHWYLTSDGDYDYELVLGFSAGFEPNENEFTNADGDALCLKWARIKRNSAMGEYDIDYEFPYDEETGEAWDSEVSVNDYDMTDDVKWLVKDFLKYADNNLGIDEACGKKIRKEDFDPNYLEKVAKNDTRKFADLISNEIADMDWGDYIDGNGDSPDEDWELFVDETYKQLLNDPQAVIDYIEDSVEEEISVPHADEFIRLINKYYINGTKESFRRPSKKIK